MVAPVRRTESRSTATRNLVARTLFTPEVASLKSISIVDFGAIPNDSTLSVRNSNTVAINAALETIRNSACKLTFPSAGPWYHSGQIFSYSSIIDGGSIDTTLFGDDGTTTPVTAVRCYGNGSVVKNLKIKRNATTRNNSSTCHGLVIDHCYKEGEVSNVVVESPAGVGVFHYSCKNMVESNISVVNSYADGIHYTGGSADIVLNGATIAGSGDDYVAVVSYLKDERYCERITIKNVSGSGQLLAGRGLTVVGGKDITYEDCQVTGTVQFGLYVASEAANNTYGTRNVTFRRCSTLDTGTVGTANIGDSIRVTGRSGTAGGSAFPADLRTCENTTFEQCSGTWTLDPENAGRTIGDCNGFSFFANSTQVTLQNCSIKNAKRNGIEAQGVTGVSINLTVVDTPGQYGIALSTPVNAAPASISNVQLIEINARQTVFSHAIRLDTGNPAPAITGTTHTQPTGRAVSGARFISAGAVNNGTITSCTSPWVNALGTGWTIT